MMAATPFSAWKNTISHGDKYVGIAYFSPVKKDFYDAYSSMVFPMRLSFHITHTLTHTHTYHIVIMSRRRRAHSISSMPFILFSVAIRSRLSGVYIKVHMIRSE